MAKRKVAAFADVEAKLGVQLPERYKLVFSTQSWSGEVRRFTLREPRDCEWLSASHWSRATDERSRAAERRVLLIADDIGGDALALKLKTGSETALAEQVHRFEHDSGRLVPFAKSLLDLFERRPRAPTLEQQATALLKAAQADAHEKKLRERNVEDARIARVVEESSGDVAAAARQLGLSRARVAAALRRRSDP